MIYAVDLDELKGRLQWADLKLIEMAVHQRIGDLGGDSTEYSRLIAKAEGVRLCISYLDEIVRDVS